jgi:hypothetical protein
MSRKFDDYFDRIPEPFKNRFFDQNIYLDDSDNDWKIIREFPDYCVSRYGDVCSVRSGRMIIVKTWRNQHGHQYVQLRNGSVRKKVLVHRLVAEAFVCNPHSYPIVRHLDDDPDNNEWTNLEWGTQKDNVSDCIRNGHDFVKAVYCYELDKSFRSCADAADYFGVHRSQITTACRSTSVAIDGKYHICYLDDLEKKLADKERWLWKSGNLRRVVATNIESGEERVYRSRKEASKDLGIPDSYISNIIAGRSEQTRGWMFKDLEGKYE